MRISQYAALISLLIMMLSMTVSYSQIHYQSTYNGAGESYNLAVGDSSIFTISTTNSFGVGAQDVFITKSKLDGTFEWSRSLGGVLGDNGNGITLIGNSLYVTGFTDNFGEGLQDIYVAKLDLSGNILWEKAIGGGGDDKGYDIVQYNENSLIICGETNSIGIGAMDVCVLMIDTLGNLIWNKSVGGPLADYARDVIRTSDGDILMVGATSGNSGPYNGYVTKMDSLGNLIWARTYGEGSFIAVKEASNGEVNILGSTLAAGAGGFDIWAVNLDSLHNLNSSKIFGQSGTEWGFGIDKTSDGGIVICGETASFGFGGIMRPYILKLDNSQQASWCNVYGGGTPGRLNDIFAQKEGGLIAAGSSFYSNGYIINSTSTGFTNCLDSAVLLQTNIYTPIITVLGTASSGLVITTITSTSNFQTPSQSFSCPVFNCDLIAVTSASPLNCYGDGNGVATCTVSGGTLPYQYLWDDQSGNQSTAIANNLYAGLYYIEIADDNGCLLIDSVELIEPAPITASISITPNVLTGEGDCTGELSVTPSGGTPTYTYIWDVAGGSATTSTVTGICDGEICVSITDANGCVLDTCSTMILGLDEISLTDFGISLFPNPSNQFITIENSIGLENNYQVSLFDISGVQVISKKIYNGSIDVSSLSNGSYIMKIEVDGNVVHKIVQVIK